MDVNETMRKVKPTNEKSFVTQLDQWAIQYATNYELNPQYPLNRSWSFEVKKIVFLNQFEYCSNILVLGIQRHEPGGRDLMLHDCFFL